MISGIETLHNVIGTFHDFDLISAKKQGDKLEFVFENFWNERNDPDHPEMKIGFTFHNCEFIECTYYLPTGKKDANGFPVYQDLSTKHIGDLAGLELSVQHWEIKEGIYLLHCSGFGAADGGIIKLRFNSCDFDIFDNNMNPLELEAYRQLHQRWWSFVGTK